MSEDILIKAECDITSNSKDHLIRSIVKKSEELHIIKSNSVEDVYQSFVKREEQGTTGLVDGFAIPHAENAGVLCPGLIIYKLKNSIEWESLDGKPINFVFGILVPSKEKNTAHLKILSEIAKMLMKDNAKEELVNADSEQDIINTIEKYTSLN